MFRTLSLLARRPSHFTPICTNSLIRPTELASLQTDGSFTKGRISRTALILSTISGERFELINTYFTHSNSTESEWCSISNGLIYSLKKDQKAVRIENDNLGAVTAIICRQPPTKDLYYRYYYNIMRHLALFNWVELRWIPREMNRADRLFRI